MKKIILLLALFSFVTLHAQEYTWQDLDNIWGDNVRGFIQDSTGNLYIVAGNFLSKSVDNGKTWKIMKKIGLPANSLSCSDNGDIYYSTDSVYFSTDGGNSFTSIDDSGFLNYKKSVSFNFMVLNNNFILLKGISEPDISDSSKKNYYSAFFWSADKGNTWDTIRYSNSNLIPSCKLNPFFDKKGGMYIITDTTLFYLKDFKSEFKIIKGFDKYTWVPFTTPNFFIGDSDKVFFANLSELLYINTSTMQVERYDVPLPFYYNVRYHNGTYYLLDGFYFYASHDNLKTLEVIREAPYGPQVPPLFEITNKGAIIYKDEWGYYFWSAPATSVDVETQDNESDARDFSSIPSFLNYIQGNPDPAASLEIYDMTGSLLVKSGDIQDPAFSLYLTRETQKLLFYKLSGMGGIFYGKILNME